MVLNELVFASGKCLYPIGEGGGETIAHDLLAGLTRAGASVSACGAMALADVVRLNEALRRLSTELSLTARPESVTTHGGSVHRFFTELRATYHVPYAVNLSLHEHYLRDVQQRLTARPPSLLLLQAEQAPQVLEIARAAKVSTMLYAQNGLELDAFPAPRAIGVVLANSRFLKQHLQQKYQVRCELLYPAVDL